MKRTTFISCLLCLASLSCSDSKPTSQPTTPQPVSTQATSTTPQAPNAAKEKSAETVALAGDCGTYPNCNSKACIGKKLCVCKKNDAGKVCGPVSCIDSRECN